MEPLSPTALDIASLTSNESYPGFDTLPALISGADNPFIHTANSPATRGANRLTFAEGARRIVDQSRGLRSLRAPTTSLRVAGNRLFIGDGDYRLEDAGWKKLAGYLHAPAAYLEQLPPPNSRRSP